MKWEKRYNGSDSMGLFDIFKQKEEKILTVSEAQEKLYIALSEYSGWKFLKSQRCLRTKEDWQYCFRYMFL